MGYSLGSGPACYLGSRYPLAGVVLLNGFASVLQIAGPFRHWPGDPLENADRLKERPVPVLIVHGTEDRTIPFRNAEANCSAAAGRKRLVAVPGAGHGQGELLRRLGEERFFEGFCGMISAVSA